MNKLLSANLFRLKRSKLFHIELIAMCLLGVIETVIATIQHKIHLSIGIETHLDSVFFGYSLFIGIFMAIFISLFIGTEYSDGTLRNKIISGHLRKNIYFSNLITSVVAAILLCTTYIIVVTVIGTPFMGFVTQSMSIILLKYFGSIILALSFCSIFTLISMLLNDKAIVAIFEILIVAIFSIIAFVLNDYPDWLRESTGIVYFICSFFHSVLPMGQSIQYADVDYSILSMAYIWKMIVCSLLISILATVIGSRKFVNKDLK